MAKRGQSDQIGVTEAAKLLGVSDRQVRNMIAAKLLPAVSIGGMWIIKRADISKVPQDRKPGRKAKR